VVLEVAQAPVLEVGLELVVVSERQEMVPVWEPV